jgi:hypothetical protein
MIAAATGPLYADMSVFTSGRGVLQLAGFAALDLDPSRLEGFRLRRRG